jgi:chromosome segregation ATPase
MSERSDLHVRVAELEEALTEVRSEVERVRVAPDDDPERIERRASARLAKHRDRVAGLEAELADVNGELAKAQRLIEAARSQAGETSKATGRLIGIAIFAFATVIVLFHWISKFFL